MYVLYHVHSQFSHDAFLQSDGEAGVRCSFVQMSAGAANVCRPQGKRIAAQAHFDGSDDLVTTKRLAISSSHPWKISDRPLLAL